MAPDKTASRPEGQPKPKRGRPPKNPDGPPAKRGRPRKNAGQGTAEDPFAEQSAVAPIAVPPEPVQEVGDGIGEEPAPQDQQVIEVPPNQPPPPTRATFAGRTRVGSESFQKQWDDRRAKYYQMVPPELWKDGLERDFWALCSQCESLDDAVVKFLEKNPANKPLDQPPNHRLAAAPVRQAKQPKAAAKVKSKPACPGGRGRGAGRGRGKGRKGAGQ